MKKYIVFALLLMAWPVFFFSRKEEKPAPSKPVLVVGVECDYVPNSWEEIEASESNIPIANHAGYYAEGYDVQIAKLVASQLDFVLEVRKIAWNDLLPSLESGDIDAIFSSMLDTEERRKIAAFSEPYEARKTEYAIIVHSEGNYTTAKTLKDFSSARIIGERGTKLDDVIEQIPGVLHLMPLDTVPKMMDFVIRGEADGAVIDTDSGHFYELTNKNLTLIEFHGDDGFNLGFRGVCAGVRKGNTELLHKINVALTTIDYSERQKIMDSVNTRMVTNLH